MFFIQCIHLSLFTCSPYSFRHRPHSLNVLFSHQAPALLDEDYPIAIEITNNDDRPLDVIIDVLLQPVEIDKAGLHLPVSDETRTRLIFFRNPVQYIIHDNQRSCGLIKGIQCGIIAPGVSMTKTLFLVSAGSAADRTIDISVQSSIPTNPLAGGSPSESHASSGVSTPVGNDTSEILQTLVIPTAAAFWVTQNIEYFRSLHSAPPFADLGAFENESWHGGEAIVTTTIECSAACGVEIQSVKLMRQVVLPSLPVISY